MKNIKSFKLFESPDTLILNDKTTLKVLDSQSISFVIDYSGNTFVSNFGEDHSDMRYRLNCVGSATSRYSGRLWVDEKVISFWRYPNKDDIKNVIQKISNALIENGIISKPIYEDDWKIEVIYNTEKEIFGETEELYKTPWYNSTISKKEIIPLKDYYGSESHSEEEYAIHLLSWEEKQKLKKKGWGKGWGSDLTAWDGKNPLWWRQAKYQENFNNIKSFKLFESPDEIQISGLPNGRYSLNYEDNDAVAFTTDFNDKKVVVAFETAWDSKNLLAWRQAKYQENLNNNYDKEF